MIQISDLINQLRSTDDWQEQKIIKLEIEKLQEREIKNEIN